MTMNIAKYIGLYLILGISCLFAADCPEPIWWEDHLWIPNMLEHAPQCPCGNYDKHRETKDKCEDSNQSITKDSDDILAEIKDYIIYELEFFLDDKWSEKAYLDGKFEVLYKIYSIILD